MSDEKAAPKFMKPGDDPELDRMLDEARRDGPEPVGEFYYDIFGRRRRISSADQDAPTLGQSDRNEKGAPTAPAMTDTRPAGVPVPMPQSRVLALSVLGIVGPVLVLAIVALRPAAGAQGKRPDGLPPKSAAASPGVAIELPSTSAMPAPKDGSEEPARTTEPTGTALTSPSSPAKLGPKGLKPRSSGEPRPDPSVKPRRPDPSSDIW